MPVHSNKEWGQTRRLDEQGRLLFLMHQLAGGGKDFVRQVQRELHDISAELGSQREVLEDLQLTERYVGRAILNWPLDCGQTELETDQLRESAAQ